MTKQNLDRRTFVKSSLLASLALLLGPHSLAQAGALEGVRVIVIGAGCAGLGAARTLADSGAIVTVVEAKPNIGGRLLTDWSMGAPFEVGAGWIHGPAENNPTRQLADAVHAKYVVTDDESLKVFNDKAKPLSEAALERLDRSWVKALKDVDEILESHDKRSLAKVLKGKLKDKDFEWAMSAYTEFSLGGPLEDLSATLFDEGDAFDNPDVVVTSGYDELLNPLAKDLDIRLSTPVRAIEYSDEGVKVSTDQDELRADYVICSVPLGVLKAGSIKFDPPLPKAYRKNIETLGFGTVTKVAFKFDHPFWDINTQYFGFVSKPKGRWNYRLNYRTFSDENILLGLSVGAYAPLADRMPDAQLKEDALKVLKQMWDDVPEPQQMLRTSWLTDPYSLGAYAYPTPGSNPDQFDDLSEPIEERLLLCGEHTLFDYVGTTHGAFMSGLRAAELILDNES